jgi:hypothetical protein
MAIVVMHIESETNYVMLGTGFGAWATDKPGFMGFSDRNDGLTQQSLFATWTGSSVVSPPAIWWW